VHAIEFVRCRPKYQPLSATCTLESFKLTKRKIA